MAFNYSSQKGAVSLVKLRVEEDGELFTVADGYGETVTSVLSERTAFAANPVRSATGVWSVTMKDPASKILDVNIQTLLPTASYLAVQLKPTTSNSTSGALVLNWVFNVAGTPTDLPSTGTPQFLIHVVWSESS